MSITEDEKLSNTLFRRINSRLSGNVKDLADSKNLGSSTAAEGLLHEESNSDGIGEAMDMSSTSSGAPGVTSTNAFLRMIRDFKKVLGERKTPKNLIYLNRVMLLMFSLSIILAAIEYS